MKQHDRQSFLGPNSDRVLATTVVGIVGVGGGGSHIQQQLAHLGVRHYVIIDPDRIELTNLNRLVGATWKDVLLRRRKVDISKRVIRSVLPCAHVKEHAVAWQEVAYALRECDVIFGCIDSVMAKEQLEAFCRRFLIPYIDIGMDVHEIGSEYFVGGQIALSVPGGHCLRCMRVITETSLTEEARNYGAAGGRPQVVWPNGLLASSAVGLFTQLVTPWHTRQDTSALLEYDGNKHTIVHSARLRMLSDHACSHYKAQEVGDPLIDVRKPELVKTTIQVKWMAKLCSALRAFVR